MADFEGCVVLALSTFRKSERAVYTAMQEAKKTKKLLVVYVVDVNLARYFIGAEHGLMSEMKETCETDLLRVYEQEGRSQVEEIAAKARLENIDMESIVQIGRFAVVCLGLIAPVKPSMVVTTRSRRPEWVKKFFGSPVDELIEKAGCPVVVT